MNIKLWLTAILIPLLFACGGGGEAAGPTARPLMAGDANASAVAVLPDVPAVRAAPADTSADGTLLTHLNVVLAPGATIANVNAAAATVGASAFAFARPNSPFLGFVVPRQSDPAALESLAATLDGRAGIAFAAAARRAQALEVPNAGGTTAAINELDYLLATRFPAAWNVRSLAEKDCGARKVTLIVPDFYFGQPSGFTDQMQGSIDPASDVPLEPLAPLPSDTHGYEVVGTLTARFDALLSHGANPSPQCLRIRIVDGEGIGTPALIDKLARVFAEETGPLIVSSSFGFKNNDDLCPTACLPAALTPAFATAARSKVKAHFVEGIQWAAFALQPGVADRVLLVQAAGNDADRIPGSVYAGLRSAQIGSPIALGAVIGDLETIANDNTLWTAADPALPALTLDPATIAMLKQLRDANVPVAANSDRNLLLVGSLTNQPLLADLAVSAFSNTGATLMAVGDNVSTVDFQLVSGTSFATPQVAGLASFLWLLDDDLRTLPVAQTAALIRNSSRSTGAASGILDAYATVLAVDARRQRSDVRKALLDVNGDGVFDHLDLQLFKQAYAVEPTTRDYSRFDLNGDGATGGIGTERFDLDAGALDPNGAAHISEVTLKIEGYDVTMNEAALSDLQILCYYAYLSDNAGNPIFYDTRPEALTERTRLLGPDACVGVHLAASLPAQITSSATLTASVQVPTGNGLFRPGAGLLVEMVSTCATTSPTSATAAADGTINATVTADAGCTALSIDVITRADANSKPLARQTVTATVAGGSFVISMASDSRVDFSTYVLSPSRQSQATVQQLLPDGRTTGCRGASTCIAHWTATGGTMIDGRPDGSAAGTLGTYTAGAVMGRFTITATSPTAEFAPITASILIGPVGTYSVHACTFFQDEATAVCADSSAPRFEQIPFFDATGDGRYGMFDSTFLTDVAPVVFELVNGAPSNFKALVTCGFTSPPGCVNGLSDLVGLAITDVSLDATGMRFLATTFRVDTGNVLQHQRVTLTRIP